MSNGNYAPERNPSDMNALTTVAKDNLVAAINENVINLTKTEKVAKFVMGTTGTVQVFGIPSTAKMLGWQVNISVAYTAGATITIGDFSGALGALAATSLVTAAGTATSTGDYSAFLLKNIVGQGISVAIAGAPVAGAGTVFVRYIDS